MGAKEEAEALAVRLTEAGYVRAALPPLWSGRRGLRLGGRYEATMVIEGKEGERAGYEMWMPAWWEPLSEAPLDKQYEVLDKIQDDLRNFGPGDADVVTLVKGLL